MSTRMTVDFIVSDLERIRRFYEGALAVRPEGEGHWIPFPLSGATFALHGSEGETTSDVLQRLNLSFEVDDIEAALVRFEAQGAKVLRGITDEAFGKSAILQDPDGRQFWLMQPGDEDTGRG